MRFFLSFVFICCFPLCFSLPLYAAVKDELPGFNDITAEKGSESSMPATVAEPLESFSVVLKPRREAVLSAEVDARVERVLKEFGQSFRKGEKLVQLDSTLYRLRLKKAKAEEAKEQTAFTAISDLYKNKSSSIIELEEARLNLSNAKTEVVFARYKLDRCTISAPYNGRVVAHFWPALLFRLPISLFLLQARRLRLFLVEKRG